MNSFYFDKMHRLYNQNKSCVKSCQKHCFLKTTTLFSPKTHCFPKKPIVFEHVHFNIPLFWNEKLSLALIDVPSSECVNCLLTRNSLVNMCLLLYVFLQQIGKNGVAANARGCLYVQHYITTKKVSIYLLITIW